MRKRLGTLSGMGVLRNPRHADNGTAVRYRLHVFATDSAKFAEGSFAGDMQELTARRTSVNPLELVLEDGGTVAVIVSRINEHGVHFQVSGPVPGF